MSLKLKIEQEIKTAMLQKNKDRLRALRAIKSLILLSETEKGFFGELDSETETKLLSKAAKQRRDSLTIFQVQNRPDLVAVEQGELQQYDHADQCVFFHIRRTMKSVKQGGTVACGITKSRYCSTRKALI